MPSSPSPADIAASGTTHVRDLIGGPARTATVLGRFATALYLRLAAGEVIAMLTSDAVRLPIGLTLPVSSRQLALSSLRGPVVIGSGVVQVGGWRAQVSRIVSSQAPAGLTPDSDACDYLRLELTAHPPMDVDPGLVDAVLNGVRASGTVTDLVDRLLGVGPGLTPAGDDMLAGLLVGSWSFGQSAEPLRSAVLAAAPARTTDLSAALLRCAARGESIPQVDQVLRSMSVPAYRSRLAQALERLTRVGHSSGAALATGVLAAATTAQDERPAEVPDDGSQRLR